MLPALARVMALAAMALMQRDRAEPFHLGMTSVTVTAPATVLAPITDHIDQNDIRSRNALSVDQAIEYMPGVSIDHKAPRNQTGISIGGFDGRQVPLYLDGIPAYVPYDGYVDLGRYLTSDVAQVQVAKGYASPLLGPNIMGGVVNLVTRQPQAAIDADAFAGTAPGRTVNAGGQLGTRQRAWFAQGTVDRLQSDFYHVSADFPENARQPGDRRTNSARRDTRARARAGWTPAGRGSYVVSYVAQRGSTGVPPYSGTAPACPSGITAATAPCVTPKYWRWPKWDVDSVYANAQTAVGRAGSLVLRAFSSRYATTQAMFDDASYSTMNLNASSGTIDNRDRSLGASGEFDVTRFARQSVAASFFVKTDTHAEQTTTFSKTNEPSTTPSQTDRDRQSSFGLQDTIVLSSALTATAGISVDHLNGLQAEDLSADRKSLTPFPTDHVWAYNPVASLAYAAGHAGTAFAAFAHKSRFPTIRDRYSYKAGRALPNPGLKPEQADTWTAGYSRTLAWHSVAQVDVFHSRVHDMIANIFFLSPLCAGGGGRGSAGSCQQAVNAGTETRAGVNVAVRTMPARALTLDGNYGYLHRAPDGTTTVFPVGTPVHKGMASAAIRLPRAVTAMASVQYQSGARGMSDNGFPLPANGFTRVDLGATFPVAAGTSVQAGVSNALDRSYYYWEGFPEAGRTGYVTLRVTFRTR